MKISYTKLPFFIHPEPWFYFEKLCGGFVVFFGYRQFTVRWR